MVKIRTITFHSSYNYGSCLQAYALQEYIKKIYNNKCSYKIINLRTNIQKEMYTNCYKSSGINNYIKRIIFYRQKEQILMKEQNFEKFINEKLNITCEYSDFEGLKKEKWSSDYYIAGSDQLWNLQARDFDWANYLEFIDNGKKISYAASFGPKAQVWNEQKKNRVKEDLLKFDSISVRENGSFNNVKELTGIEPEIHVDPTMLLQKNEWESIIPSEPIYKGKYIFLYNLKGKEYIKLAKKISKQLKLPIVVSKYSNKLEIVYGFEKKYNCGPVEFLNLIKHAELVLSSSFHGTIFSILLSKPFFSLNGNKDFRIHTLLEKMKLQDRSIEVENYQHKCINAFDVNFEQAEQLLNEERRKSEEYLKRNLDIE